MNNRLEELRALGLVRRSPAIPRGYRYERASETAARIGENQ